MIALGIDPGKLGGLAWIAHGGTVLRVEATPLIPGRGAGEYDLRMIRSMLIERPGVRAFIEVLPDLPPGPQFGGMKAARARGVAEGWAWSCAMLQIPYELVSPRAWQRVMLADVPGDDTKARSVLAAQRLFPTTDLRATPRCRKASDGIADALLIAEWGRRRLHAAPLQFGAPYEGSAAPARHRSQAAVEHRERPAAGAARGQAPADEEPATKPLPG